MDASCILIHVQLQNEVGLGFKHPGESIGNFGRDFPGLPREKMAAGHLRIRGLHPGESKVRVL
jgi:hypothetical protein